MLLTIAIPTYNRHEELSQCLDSIKGSWHPTFSGKVNLVISSNASTDKTDAIVENFHIPGLKVTYEKQTTNFGPIRNFLRVAELADSKFCWLISDDDSIYPESLRCIINVLEKNTEIGGILLKFIPWKYDLSAPLSEKPIGKPGEKIYNAPYDPNTIVELIHDWGLLSVCVFKTSKWRKALGNIPIKKAGFYPHVWIQAEMLRNSKSWAIIGNPQVRFRKDRDSFLTTNGALQRALMPIESYGGLSQYYRQNDPILSKCALDLCCGFTKHYLIELKKGWGSSADNKIKNHFHLVKECIARGGLDSALFFSKVIPALLLPSIAIKIISKMRSLTE